MKKVKTAKILDETAHSEHSLLCTVYHHFCLFLSRTEYC